MWIGDTSSSFFTMTWTLYQSYDYSQHYLVQIMTSDIVHLYSTGVHIMGDLFIMHWPHSLIFLGFNIIMLIEKIRPFSYKSYIIYDCTVLLRTPTVKHMIVEQNHIIPEGCLYNVRSYTGLYIRPFELVSTLSSVSNEIRPYDEPLRKGNQ